MSETPGGRAAFSYKSAELVVAGLFFLLGAVVVFDSIRLGSNWNSDGPQAGYFPFYLGVIICTSSAITFVLGLFIPAERNEAFVEVGQLKLVLSVLVPSSVYVALIGWLGIYVASALFVALFMRWLGKYSWWMVALVSIGNSVVFFLIFELWFLVPLPKGPLEALLHIN
jgi:putative tricarboxylic transport membrane protein